MYKVMDISRLERINKPIPLNFLSIWLLPPWGDGTTGAAPTHLSRHRYLIVSIESVRVKSLSPVGPQSQERALLERLGDCRQVFDTFNREDQFRVRQVLEILTGGMERDLRIFPGEDERHLAACGTLSDLDANTYSVAGCVGDFWTRMMCAHRPAFRGWDPEAMAKIGIRLGKGLQLTNVLRDIPQDLRRGRCYIPEALLAEAGLKPADLLEPRVLPQFKPVLIQLLRIGLDHLDQGWLYAMAIPRREWRVCLACICAISFTLKTRSRISPSR